MYTLLDTPSLFNKLDIYLFLDRVLQGLRDPAQEIQILGHLMLIKLCQLGIAATVLQQRLLDDVVDPVRSTLMTKLKETAVKQEIEKQAELVRSALRGIAAVTKTIGLAGGAGTIISGTSAGASSIGVLLSGQVITKGSSAPGASDIGSSGSTKFDALLRDIRGTPTLAAQFAQIIADMEAKENQAFGGGWWTGGEGGVGAAQGDSEMTDVGN
jgi:hypothetical protein